MMNFSPGCAEPKTDALHCTFFSAWKAVSAYVDHSNVRFSSVNLVTGLAISANQEISPLKYLHSTRKLLNWCLSCLDQLFTASNFSGFLVTPEGEMMWPRYSTSFRNSWYFAGFNLSWASRSLWNIIRKVPRYSWNVRQMTITSSKYTRQAS